MYFIRFIFICLAIIAPIRGLDSEVYLEWYENQVKGSPLPALEVDCGWVLPDAGIIKKSYTVICPSHCLDVNHCIRVKGSGPYAVNSPVCMAAIHAGIIKAHTGGAIDVSVVDGKEGYSGSRKNGVDAIAYNKYFASFYVQKSDVSCEKPNPTLIPCHSTALLDMVFVADSSLSVHPDNFILEKKFISDLVSHFPIGPKQARVGLITFNDEAKTRFGLEKYTTAASLLKAIYEVNYEMGGTYVGKALWELTKSMNFRSDPAVHKIVIVFTDGKSYDSVKRPVKALAAKGVRMIAFGIANPHEETLLDIADGKKDNVFSAKSYGDLTNFVDSLVTKICAFAAFAPN